METYPILLVVGDFGVEYVGKQHADHLAIILKNITISLKIRKVKKFWNRLKMRL